MSVRARLVRAARCGAQTAIRGGRLSRACSHVLAIALLLAAGLLSITCGGGSPSAPPPSTPAPTPPPPPAQPNRAPTVAIPIPNVTLERDRPRTFSLALYFSDPDGDRLTYAATTSDPLTAAVRVTGSEVTLTALRDGTVTVTVTARDPGGLSASQDFTATVGEGNRHPTALGNIADQTLTLGGRSLTVDLAPRFSDPDGDQLTFRVTSSDSGVVSALISESGLILVPVAAGTASVTVTATDPGGLSATQTFEVTVGAANRDPVTVGSIPDQRLTAGGSPVTLDVASSFSDPDGDQLTFEASSSDSGVVRAVVSGTEVILIPAAAGTATVTVTATDPGGLSATQTFEVTVGTANRAPTAVGSIPDQSLAAGGSAVTLNVSPNFTDPDGDILSYAVTSSDSAVVRAIVSENEVVLIPGSTGTATVTVTATDPQGLSAVQRFRATVDEPVRAPSTPTGFIVSGRGDDYIEWRWNAVSGAEGYEVQFSEDGEFTSADPSHDVGAELTYRQSGLAYDTRGYLRVRAYVGSDAERLSSGWTEAATGLTNPAPPPPPRPAVPQGLAATGGEDFVEWTWRAVPDVDGYQIQYSENEAFTSTDPTEDLSAETLSYTKEDLEPGTPHYLRVRSFIEVDGARYESAWSSHVTGMTVAATDDHGDTERAATRIGAPSSTEGELEAAGDVDYFRFQLRSSGRLAVHTTGTIDTIGLLTGPNGLRESNDDSGEGTNFRIVVAGASPGDYYVAVSGYATSTGLYELQVTLTTSTISPPQGLRVTDTGEDFIEWSWDDVPDADGYEVQFRRDTDFSEADRVYRASGTSVRAISLLANTEYYIRVRTVVGAGAARQESAWSRPVSGRTARDFRTDHRFNRPFWDAIAFDGYECPGEGSCPDYYRDGSASRALQDRVLVVLPTTGPNFHIRTHNDRGERRMPSPSARRIREAIPGAVEALTGEPYTGDITTGPDDVEREGWITIEFMPEEDDPDFWESDDPEAVVCGRARVGAVVGRVWLNSSRISDTRCLLDPLVRHEVGHAVGFFHVSGNRDLMAVRASDTHHFTSREEYHAQLAYELGRYRPYTSGPLMLTLAEQREAPTSFPEQTPIVICRGR